MQDFDYLVKKRDRALGLFQKVIRKLQAIEEKISKLLGISQMEVTYHSNAIEFFKRELERTQAHRAKIENLTSVPDAVNPTESDKV